jgi:hypothetical protein
MVVRKHTKRTIPVFGQNTLLRPLPLLEPQRTHQNAHARRRHHRTGHHRMKTQIERKEESHGERDTENLIYARPDDSEGSFYRGEDVGRQVEGCDDAM